MIVCRRDLKTSTGELLQVINTYINVAGYKINSKKLGAFPAIYKMIKELKEKSEKNHLSK